MMEFLRLLLGIAVGTVSASLVIFLWASMAVWAFKHIFPMNRSDDRWWHFPVYMATFIPGVVLGIGAIMMCAAFGIAVGDGSFR